MQQGSQDSPETRYRHICWAQAPVQCLALTAMARCTTIRPRWGTALRWVPGRCIRSKYRTLKRAWLTTKGGWCLSAAASKGRFLRCCGGLGPSNGCRLKGGKLRIRHCEIGANMLGICLLMPMCNGLPCECSLRWRSHGSQLQLEIVGICPCIFAGMPQFRIHNYKRLEMMFSSQLRDVPPEVHSKIVVFSNQNVPFSIHNLPELLQNCSV